MPSDLVHSCLLTLVCLKTHFLLILRADLDSRLVTPSTSFSNTTVPGSDRATCPGDTFGTTINHELIV